MAFSTPYTFTALELLTAAKMNAIQANISAMWVGTTAGDIDYYTSSSAKNRVALGTEYKALRVNSGATAPAWEGIQFASVYHSATQNVSNGAPATTLSFDSEYSDVPGWHTTTSRITVTKDGYYQSAVYINYTGASGDGSNYWDTIEHRINGTAFAYDRRLAIKDANSKLYCSVSPIIGASATNYFEVSLEQTSGGTRTVAANAKFSVWRVY